MLHKINYFIYKHELKLGILGFILSFLYYVYFPGNVTLAKALPGLIFWMAVFLIADGLNKKTKNGSIYPHRSDQLKKLERLSIAALVMNLISDITGSWILKLWYYPPIKNPILYFTFLAPIGYILFGLVLFIIYKIIKNKYDYLVKPGKPTKIKSYIFTTVIYSELIIGIIGLVTSLYYYKNFIIQNNIIWYRIYESVKADVNIFMFITLWLSIFFLGEFICFKLNRETLTRDLIRGNLIPLFSIFVASFICIILIEIANAPIQIWSFTNWPYQNVNVFNIPVIAYFLWPMQYLLLLPIIRIVDGKNEENIW